MLKFFRRIRQKLLNEGSLRKYLVYAIGEIFLVMVGILLALQVNNWNEKRLEALQEKTTLSNLNTEFKENLKNLDSINKYLLKTISATETIFSMFQEESHLNISNIDSLLQKALDSPSWKPSEFVLNDLKNSGGLSKLKNIELKKLLFKWTCFFNELKESMDQIENTNLQLLEHIKIYGSLRNIDTEDKSFKYNRSRLSVNNMSLLKSYQFENYIDDKLYILTRTKDQYKDTKLIIQEILDATITE